MQTMSGTRTLSGEPPRSTAYYYADLERLKRKNGSQDSANLPGPNIPPPDDLTITRQQINELSEYVESNEVVNDGAVREVPPLRDRVRQWSLPEYNTPERKVLEETYSTAGTFPMPEPKEKEPLLAELEVVGRLPLTQLETTSGVRRSRSWYLCCPNVPDEEISRESSWRYSSLRPVTAAPLPGQNGLSLVATHSTGREDASSLRAERDALARALAGERQRAAAAARAHDARLAELHGVIAELVRRRAQDKHATAIPEEEVSDECESTTQPAGELDNDADRSRTEQNDTSSILSPAELPTPQEQKVEPPDLPDDTTDTSSHDNHMRVEQPVVMVTSPLAGDVTDNCDTSLNLSERDSEICLTTARCCQHVRHTHTHTHPHPNTHTHTLSAGSCEREHGSSEGARVYTASPGRCESRQAKLASRVRLRRTDDTDSTNHLNNEEAWCSEAAERLALDVCAQADLREALVSQLHDGTSSASTVCMWRARCLRLQADCRVLTCALARATDTQHRLYCACAVQESCSVSLCVALKAADRALETYDVLLALAETNNLEGPEREAAELVARQLLCRLDEELTSAAIGEPLLSPGPWLQHDNHVGVGVGVGWSAECESRLRGHAARLKRETVSLREHAEHTPTLFSYHDVEEEEIPKPVGHFSMADMEAAVMMQEVLTAREVRATTDANNMMHSEQQPQQQQQQQQQHEQYVEHKSESTRSRRPRRRDRHWLDSHVHTHTHTNKHAQASETDL